ncbi:MAG: glycosyltransferase family 9 protein [Pseudomonadota bacterium]|uniref:glycosyltransferase family 9 protein n=1 Tax=Sphingobium sp. TaxID=1912891 RepID=UPI002E1A0AB1
MATVEDGARWVAAMRANDHAAAWALSDAVLKARDPATRDDPCLPYHLRWVWDGRAFDGRDCLVRCYHGLGDTVQFARFLPLLARRAASVVVEAPARLLGLLQRIAPAANVRFLPFDVVHPLPPSECDIEITELAFALRATPADAPWPYLSTPRAILPHGTVGLCYAAGDWDGARGVPPALFAPLCACSRCITLVPQATGLPVLNPRGCPFDMDATAALVAACDLVITVDTLIAHLAGAMGRPTWLLLKADPDWRWPVDSDATPWYPSMHIHAQRTAGDWREVMADVARDLGAFTLSPAASKAP